MDTVSVDRIEPQRSRLELSSQISMKQALEHRKSTPELVRTSAKSLSDEGKLSPKPFPPVSQVSTPELRQNLDLSKQKEVVAFHRRNDFNQPPISPTSPSNEGQECTLVQVSILKFCIIFR